MDCVREMIEGVGHKVVLTFVNTASAAGEPLPTGQSELIWTVLNSNQQKSRRTTFRQHLGDTAVAVPSSRLPTAIIDILSIKGYMSEVESLVLRVVF
jgi:hypothetical protein